MNFRLLSQRFRNCFLLACCLSFCLIQHLYGQGVTTGTISGRVTDAESGPLPGSTIRVIHIPSGTEYAASTQEDGRFTLPGVRVGGPYTIIASFVGFTDETINNARVALGETLTLDIILTDASTELEGVTVTASRSTILNSGKNGSGVMIGEDKLQSMPTVSRSLHDFTRLVPQAGGQGMMGKGGKSNFLSVDGAAFNNAFGLGTEMGGTPGANANAQPISLDAIEQVAVNLSPYDVKQGGFTGAGINAVTRSGDNQFRGSVYTFFRNQSLVGNKVKNTALTRTDFNETTWGFRIGGPIVKDKLFFFGNYERFTNTAPGADFLAARPGLSGSNISNIQASDLDALSNFLQSTYGYYPGSYESYDVPTENQKFLIKLDWNISTNHKMSIRYNQLLAKSEFGATSALSSIGYSNNGYSRNNDIYSITGELNSTINPRVTNRLFVSYTSLPDYREYFGDLFPRVIINDEGNTYTFGTDFAARGNRVTQRITQVQDDVTFHLDEHRLTAGISWQYLDFANSFTLNPQGTFTFSSLADFYNSAPAGTETPVGPSTGGGLPVQYSLGYTTQPGNAVTDVGLRFSQLGVYAQDEFFPAANLKLTAGIRLDAVTILDEPGYNEEAADLTFQSARGEAETYNTNNLPGTSILVSPRVGFNWDVTGDRAVQIRGGSGLFTGNIPFVYITSAFSNNGLNAGAISAFTPEQAAAYPFNPDPDAYVPEDKTASPTYQLDLVSDDFKMPQSWRSTLGVDIRLPQEMVASIEAIYSRDINAPYYRNANLDYETATTAPDGRLRYTNARLNPNITGAYVLDNISEGHQLFLTASLNKQFNEAWAASFAYTYSDTKDVFSFRSTSTFGAFTSTQIVNNPNVPVVAYGDFDLRHRVVGSVNYQISYARNRLSSRIGLFIEGAQQGRASYTYGGSGDVNQDGASGNDLIYVPRELSEINLVATESATVQEQWEALDAFIAGSEYLSPRRGQFAERNGLISPWYFMVDLKFAQNVGLLLGETKNSLEFTVDILNFTNLLNKEWGVFKTPANLNPVTALSENTFTVNPALLQNGEFTEDTGLSAGVSPTYSSRYRIQFGIRYTFN